MKNVGPGEIHVEHGFAHPDVVDYALKNLADNLFIKRDWGIETYGRVWYVDIAQGKMPQYHLQAARTNSFLQALMLRPVMLKVAPFLVGPSGENNLPVRSRSMNVDGEWWADYGIVRFPAPNIPRGQKTVRTGGGIPHPDHEGIAIYPELLTRPSTRAYSAVLCLEKAGGGGLRFWPRRVLASEEYGGGKDEEYIDVDYSVGSMAVFDSFCYHQIKPSIFNREKRNRTIAGIHFLYKPRPYPHWEYWF